MSNKLLKDVLDIATMVAPMIVPGAAQAIALGKKIKETLESAKEIGDGEMDADIQSQIDDLQERINARAEDTIDRLENG